MSMENPSESSPGSESPAPLYGAQSNPFANFSYPSAPTPQAPSSFESYPKPGGLSSNTSADDLSKRSAPLSMSAAYSAPPQQQASTSAQIVQNQQKLQLQQLSMYRTQQQQQQQQPQSLSQSQTLGSAQLSQQIQSQIQQQQLGQQQQQLQQFMTVMTENFDKLNKCLAEVDQRISSLEKSTREIMVNQKTQKELLQQQLNQILQKISDVRTTIPQFQVPTHPTSMGLAPMNLGIPIPAPSAPTFVQTSTTSYGGGGYNNNNNNKRDQEDTDAELARRLQAELNAESSRTAAPSRPVEPTEECPLCNEKVPKSGLENHVNKHFDEEPSRSAAAANSTEGGLWSKLFGNKQAEAEKKRLEDEAARKKKEDEETLRNKNKSSSNTQQQQQQQQPQMQAIPYQQPYYLAAPFQGGMPTMVYRPPGATNGLYPGQVVFDPSAQPYNAM